MLRYKVMHENRIYRITTDLMGTTISSPYKVIPYVKLEGLSQEVLEILYFRSTYGKEEY